MDSRELKALVSLLEDDDREVSLMIEQQIRSLGDTVIPFLEDHWENSGFNPHVQKRIEDLIHDLQLRTLTERLKTWKNNGTTDLLEGLWLIATYQYPDLSLEKIQREIDQIYYDAWLEFHHGMHPARQIDTLNYVFFKKMKFGANTKNFHSASNSMLNIVLETRKGNPISLCVLYMLVGRRLGMPLYGVNLPNLFVLTYKQNDVQFYINVFNKGLVFQRKDIDSYIAQLNLAPSPIFYNPCSNLDILRRVLRNLTLAFEKTGDDDRVQEINRLLKILLDSDNPNDEH
ncbi:MAG: transglutaminase-like domain-containing protein [Siphonobacter sp.]